jgi:hypothetical protein
MNEIEAVIRHEIECPAKLPCRSTWAIGGADLGAPGEISLFPSRAGAQAVIQIDFTAPFTDGEYESAWQAFAPDGFAFGDPLYIRVNAVSP